MRQSYLRNHYSISETAEGSQFVTDNDVVYIISFIKLCLMKIRYSHSIHLTNHSYE